MDPATNKASCLNYKKCKTTAVTGYGWAKCIVNSKKEEIGVGCRNRYHLIDDPKNDGDKMCVSADCDKGCL